jgi:c(7)-type cytochrome triheme protein
MMMSAAAMVLGIAIGAANVAAQSMPRLPGDLKLTRSADSPGQVVFDHTTHVDSAKPNCTTCHSREFNIVKASGRREIKHDNFDKGRQCGACHDGKKAFKVEEDCTFCHRGS